VTTRPARVVSVFIVAPLVGGVLAAGLHRLLYREEDIRLAAEAQQPGEADVSPRR